MIPTIQECEKEHKDIIDKARIVMELNKRRKTLENENARKLNELKEFRSELSSVEEDQDNLATRNTAMREKFSQIDGNVKEDHIKIKDETKIFLKKLGLKLTTDSLSENLVQLKIHFTENSDHQATFVYDSITEDYDLTALNPEHPRFAELRKFLQDTKDIQGFLYNFRNSLLNNGMSED